MSANEVLHYKYSADAKGHHIPLWLAGVYWNRRSDLLGHDPALTSLLRTRLRPSKGLKIALEFNRVRS
jgi:hypothetical protein